MDEPMVPKHMETLQTWCGASTDLGPLERLTNLLLVEGLTDLQQKQHDFVQIEVTRGVSHFSRKIPLDRLFLPLSKFSIPPRILVTIGVAGVGKSTLVRLFVHTWAKGETGKDFEFVLPLTFRELNTYDRLSGERLIRLASPHLTESSFLSVGTSRTLLILDGLDEFKTPLDFSDTVVCTDLQKEIQVDYLITNIIRGHLLREVCVWVTSRPAAAGQIPGGLVDRMTEIQGFGDAEIKGFLDHLLAENQNLSDGVRDHLKANRSLYTLCAVPSFCHVCGSAVGYVLKSADCPLDASALPRTLSEIYSHYFRMVLCGHGQVKQKETPRIEQAANNNSKKMMNCLGRLAFYGLIKRKYVFYEQDMKTYGVDLSSLHISLCSRLLLKEETPLSPVYYFPHLMFQEFLAATYYYASAKRALFDLFVESGMSWPKLGFLNHFKNALQRSLQSEDGHLDVFVRFLAGLLSPQVNKALSDWLLVRDEHQGYRSQVVSVLQGLLAVDQAVSCRTVNLVRCLHEIQQVEIATHLEEALKTESLAGKLTPANLSALAYLLQTSEVCCEEANLSSCLSHHTLQSLLSQLLYCSNLRLDNNRFKDSAMDLLGSVLSGKDCHIQKISLAENQIGNKGTKALARSLMVNRSLLALDLRNNSIGPQGAKALADSLKINQCLLSLNLQKNGVGPQGSKKLAEALKKNWGLKELILSGNCVGDAGAAALAEGLKVNHTLLTLDLQSNSISDVGVTALMRALCSNRGLISLNLRENSISKEGACEIARALRANGTLRNLDLAANLLHDEGAQAIALALRENQALTSLHLQWNFLQSRAARALSQALQSNQSLASLDLQENALGDEGLAALASALKGNATLTDLYLQVAMVGESGARALAEALMTNRSLATLDLRGNAIGLAGAKAMAGALKVNGALRRVNLQENALGLDGGICIATALSGSHGLTYVNLQGNQIGESGAKVIADTIRANAPECVVEI
ncbi:UNVERIFIED_CONTAM: hypothetical protein K2H54_013836 [Gekko kuhli]